MPDLSHLAGEIFSWMRGGNSNTPWTEFVLGEMQHARCIKELYAGFLTWPLDIISFASMPGSWRHNSDTRVG